MKTFSYTIGAGETKVFPAGNFFILLSALDDVTVSYYKRLLKLDEDATNVQSGYYFKSVLGFDFVTVYSATSQVVKVGISDGTGGYIPPTNEPQTLASHWGGNVGTSLITIVTPAANVNGIRIDYAGILEYITGGTVINIMSKTSAPTSYKDVTARSILNVHHDANDTLVRGMNTPFIIPAGEGLYAQANTLASGDLTVEYKIL